MSLCALTLIIAALTLAVTLLGLAHIVTKLNPIFLENPNDETPFPR